jgi:hypothetical protein
MADPKVARVGWWCWGSCQEHHQRCHGGPDRRRSEGDQVGARRRNGIIKKADTVMTSGTKVDSPLSPEDLVHMVDVSVALKYGADLT